MDGQSNSSLRALGSDGLEFVGNANEAHYAKSFIKFAMNDQL